MKYYMRKLAKYNFSKCYGINSVTIHATLNPCNCKNQSISYFAILFLQCNHFSQTRLNGMPVAAAIQKLLLDAANGTLEDSKVPEVLTLYTKFLDIPHLSIEFKMIPDLVTIKAYNEENQPICRVTNVRTICEILNSVSSSKTMI